MVMTEINSVLMKRLVFEAYCLNEEKEEHGI